MPEKLIKIQNLTEQPIVCPCRRYDKKGNAKPGTPPGFKVPARRKNRAGIVDVPESSWLEAQAHPWIRSLIEKGQLVAGIVEVLTPNQPLITGPIAPGQGPLVEVEV